MFAQYTGTGGGFTTSAPVAQNNALLGNPQQNGIQFPAVDPGQLNTTAPQSTTPPGVANMVKALKGSGQ